MSKYFHIHTYYQTNLYESFMKNVPKVINWKIRWKKEYLIKTHLGHRSGSCKRTSQNRCVQWHICQLLRQLLTLYYLSLDHRDNSHFSKMTQECPIGKNLELLWVCVDWMTVLWGVELDLFWIMHCFRYHRRLDLGPLFGRSHHQFRYENRDNWK